MHIIIVIMPHFPSCFSYNVSRYNVTLYVCVGRELCEVVCSEVRLLTGRPLALGNNRPHSRRVSPGHGRMVLGLLSRQFLRSLPVGGPSRNARSHFGRVLLWDLRTTHFVNAWVNGAVRAVESGDLVCIDLVRGGGHALRGHALITGL